MPFAIQLRTKLKITNIESTPSMTTCSFPMGYQASNDYIRQIYNGDERMPHIVSNIFRKIAQKNNSSATLHVYTSEVRVELKEVGGVREFKKLHTAHVHREETRFSLWLRESHDKAKARWENGDF